MSQLARAKPALELRHAVPALDGRRGALIWLPTLMLLVACQTGGHRALAPAPFELSATPASVAEGGSFVLALLESGPPRREDQALDVYVSFVRDAGRAWGYLDPSGQWTPDFVPYRRIEGRRGLPFSLRFDRVGPMGWYTFRLQFVRPDSPPGRKHYVFQPLLATVRIRPAVGGAEGLVLPGLLGLLTLGAVILVILLPRGRGTPSDATDSTG